MYGIYTRKYPPKFKANNDGDLNSVCFTHKGAQIPSDVQMLQKGKDYLNYLGVPVGRLRGFIGCAGLGAS